MKELILAACLTTIATTANAVDFTAVDIKSMCGDSTEAIKHFASFGMEPLLYTEAAMVVDADEPQFPGTVVVWRNSENGNFNVSFTPAVNQDVTCVLTYGEALNRFEY